MATASVGSVPTNGPRLRQVSARPAPQNRPDFAAKAAATHQQMESTSMRRDRQAPPPATARTEMPPWLSRSLVGKWSYF
eukprot:scaffold25384_cov129-Isochrysis_galbana.AAC.10